ncbi:MAG: alpha/beta hydrolase [Pseudomonadota bacterium]
MGLRNPENDDQPVSGVANVAGLELAYAEWYPSRRGLGPTLLFIHATGFHARIWDQIVRRLPLRHTICIDMHGHGLSDGEPISHWQVLCEELTQFVRALDLQDVIAIGHSMGGHAAIAAAAALPDRFNQLILIDPVVFPPEEYGQTAKPFNGGELHPTAKRRRDFDSIEAMVERFKNRSPYALFTPETLLDYCRYGLTKKETDAGYMLACAPEMEASVYTTSRTNKAIFDCIETVQHPVLILRAAMEDDPANMSFTSSPTWPGLVDAFAHAQEIYRPDLTHFMPMEAPDEIAAIIDAVATGD